MISKYEKIIKELDKKYKKRREDLIKDITKDVHRLNKKYKLRKKDYTIIFNPKQYIYNF